MISFHITKADRTCHYNSRFYHFPEICVAVIFIPIIIIFGLRFVHLPSMLVNSNNQHNDMMENKIILIYITTSIYISNIYLQRLLEK